MIKFISAVCPNCNATLELNSEDKITKCKYFGATIMIDDGTVKINGNVSIDGIQTDRELIDNANELLDMGEFIKAKRLFEEFSTKNPDKYQGWLGLIICRTRNFKIKDNNILFENDVKKYFKYFNRTAPPKIKEEYFETIDRYIDPEKYERLSQEEEERERQEEKHKREQEEKRKQEEKRRRVQEEKRKQREKVKYEKEIKRKEQQEKREEQKRYKEELKRKVNIRINDLGFQVTRLINKIIHYCLITFFAIMTLGCFISKQYIIGVISICLAFLFSKKIKTMVKEKITVSDNLITVIRVVVIILWFILIASIGNQG